MLGGPSTPAMLVVLTIAPEFWETICSDTTRRT